MAEVTFYFNYGCPWTYLAATRLQETALRTDSSIVWKPVLIDRVRQLVSGSDASAPHRPVHEARARYDRKDMADWAAYCGVCISRGPPYPVPASWALRGAVVAGEAGVIAPYSERVFAACFGASADIDSPAVVAGIAAEVGLDAAGFSRRVAEPATLARIEGNSTELVARGGFGSPTMFLGEDMYFGNDRMPLLEWALVRGAERPLIAPGAHGQR
jgi:2-hydroxychromene-2-carboxylate isomerase